MRSSIAITLLIMLSAAVSGAASGAAAAATLDGMTIHSTTTGNGKATLVLVHGWTCDESSWREQVPILAKQYRVITLDLPGHGRSGSPTNGPLTMDLFARAVEAVRAEAGAERIVLVGHSMGAPVIRQYARRFPSRVAGLVAVDGPVDMRGFGNGFKPPVLTGAEGLKAREGMIRGMFTPQTPAALQQHILKMMLGAPERTAIEAMSSILDPVLRAADVMAMPALAVWADTAQQLPKVETAREIMPKYEQTQVPGTGHFLMMEKPEEFNRILRAFVDKVAF
jgi:pimeloyl-ACP methyl ester carboxylesterase